MQLYLSYSLYFFIILGMMLLYFRIAKRYNIVDTPNHRSSHSRLTIRGGGIIFPLGMLLVPLFFAFDAPYFMVGLFIICTVSFIDDLLTVSNKIRILCHLISVTLLFYQAHIFEFPIVLILMIYVLVIGIINAVNFMDGINGITGAYAMVTLLSLLMINYDVVAFTSNHFIICSGLSVLGFLIFNFRKKAVCFAGDVGSVGVAFILLFLLIALVTTTGHLKYLLLLLVYGLDTMTTIAFRLYRRENIFEAHRSHFYQYLANERKIPHLLVSSIYAVVQLLINGIVVYYLKDGLDILFILVLSALIAFSLLRFATEGKQRLLGN